MGIMKQANKLKGKEKEEFLKEYYAAKQRLILAQTTKPTRKQRKASKPKNGPVISYNLNDLK